MEMTQEIAEAFFFNEELPEEFKVVETMAVRDVHKGRECWSGVLHYDAPMEESTWWRVHGSTPHESWGWSDDVIEFEQVWPSTYTAIKYVTKKPRNCENG